MTIEVIVQIKDEGRDAREIINALKGRLSSQFDEYEIVDYIKIEEEVMDEDGLEPELEEEDSDGLEPEKD